MRGVAFQESAVFPVPALGAKALILYSIHCVNRNLGALKHELAVYLAALQVALRPQAQMVFISSIVWASSRRRVEPGKPRFIKSARSP